MIRACRHLASMRIKVTGDFEAISATSDASGPGYNKKHCRPPWHSCSCNAGWSSGSGNSFPTNLMILFRQSSSSGPVQRDRFSSLGWVNSTTWVSVSTTSGSASQRQTLWGRKQFGQFLLGTASSAAWATLSIASGWQSATDPISGATDPRPTHRLDFAGALHLIPRQRVTVTASPLGSWCAAHLAANLAHPRGRQALAHCRFCPGTSAQHFGRKKGCIASKADAHP